MSQLFPRNRDESNSDSTGQINDSNISYLPALVAQLHAVFAPMTLDCYDVVDMLSRAGIKVGSRNFFADQVRSSYAELTNSRVGFIAEDTKDFTLYANLILPLIRQCADDGLIETLLESYDRLYHYSSDDSLFEFLEFRGMLVSGQDYQSEWKLVREDIDPSWWRFMAEPFAKDLYDSAAPDIRLSMATGCLNHCIEFCAPSEEIIDAVENDIDVIRLTKTADIAFIRVMQGKFDLAEEHFARLPNELRNSRTPMKGRESIRGLIQTLKGNDDRAKEHIERVLDLERQGSKKKLVYPRVLALQFSLSSLIRADSVDNYDLFKRLFRAYKQAENECESDIDVQEFLYTANYARKNGELPEDSVWQLYINFQLLLYLISHTWFSGKPRKWKSLSETVEQAVLRATSNGYAWVAAEYLVLMRRFKGMSDLSKSIPRAMTHEALGTVSLCSVVQPLADWEISFRSLEQLAFDTSKKAPRKKKVAATPGQKRLVWDLDTSGYFMCATPREQTQQKSGRWGKGRKITTKRFQQQAATWDFLLPQDRAVVTALTDHGTGYGPRALTAGPEALAALAGHPHVFGESGDNVEVVLRQPELLVEKHKSSGYLVKLKPEENYDAIYPQKYLTKLVTNSRLEVTHFSPMHLKLMDIIPQNGLKVPDKVQKRLLEAIAGLSAETRVQSDASGHIQVGTLVDADPKPWVLLERHEDGLSVAIVVEPIANSDSYYQLLFWFWRRDRLCKPRRSEFSDDSKSRR